MAGRFLGDIPKINIKTGLSSAGAKAQASMWGEVGEAFGQASNMAMEVRAEQNKKKGQEGGAKYIEEGGDIKNLPQGSGVGDISFRQSAMDTYTSQLAADSSEQIMKLQEQYKDDPEQLNVSLKAYTDATIEELPVEIRANVRKNIEMKALGAYTKTLGSFTTAQVKEQKNIRLLNSSKQQKILEGLPIPTNEVEQAAFDTQLGEYAVGLDKAVLNGDMTIAQYESRIKSVTTARAKAHSVDMINTQKEVEPTLLPKTYDSIYKGSTGNQYIDSLNQEERMTLVQGTLSLEQQTKAYEESIQNSIDEEMEDTRVATQTDLYADMLQTKDTSPEKINAMLSLANSPEEVTKVQSMVSAINANVKSSQESLDSVNLKFYDGTLTKDSLTEMFLNKELSNGDYGTWYKRLDERPEHLIQSSVVKSFFTSLDNDFPKVETDAHNYKTQNLENVEIQQSAKEDIIGRIENNELNTKEKISEAVNKKMIEMQVLKTQSIWDKQGVDFKSLPNDDKGVLNSVQKDNGYHSFAKRVRNNSLELKNKKSYTRATPERQQEMMGDVLRKEIIKIKDRDKQARYIKAFRVVGDNNE